MLKKFLIVVLTILILGIFIPKFLIKDKVQIVISEEPGCSPQTQAHLFLDNPFERMMVAFGGLQVVSQDSEYNTVVRAYTIFGIPVADVFISREPDGCYSGGTRL